MNFKNPVYFFTLLLVFNCSNGSDDTIPLPDPNAKITYDANIKSIIASNCLECHGTPTANGASFSLVAYTEVKNKIDAILPRINSASSPMPPTGQMLSKNIDLIQKWKNDGLLEN